MIEYSVFTLKNILVRAALLLLISPLLGLYVNRVMSLLWVFLQCTYLFKLDAVQKMAEKFCQATSQLLSSCHKDGAISQLCKPLDFQL